MEASTISPESVNSLFNPGATSGNLRTGPGSALPFSTIMQSQQHPKLAANSPLAAGSEYLDNQTYSSNALGLEQLSLSGRNGTAAAPWLVLGLQDGSTPGLAGSSLGEDEELLLASIPEMQAVPIQADQFATPGLLPGELEQLAATGLEQSKAAQRTLELADLAQRTQDSLMRSESNRPFAGIDTELTGASTEYLQAQAGASTSDFDRLQASAASPSQLATNSMTSAVSAAGQQVVNVNSDSGLAAASALNGEGVLDPGIADQEVNAELISSRVLASSVSAGDLNQNSKPSGVSEQNGPSVLAGSESIAFNDDLGLLPTKDATNLLESGIPLPAGSLTANGSVQRTDAAMARDLRDSASGRNLSSASQSTGEININSADLLSAQNETVDVNVATASLGASIADPLNSQLRSAVPVQAKRLGGTERVDVSTAVDASEGYHWLSGAEELAPEPAAESMQTGVLEDLDGAGLTTANSTTMSTTNNVRSDAATVESFAAVKRSADVAASSATTSTEQSNSANLEIDTPVQDAQWSQALAYRVQFMAQEGIQRAQVQLNPAELGPIEITVDLADDVAKVQITAENAATREAVEQAVPRLREMMALSGFSETGVDLSNGDEQSNAPSDLAESLSQPNTGDAGSDRRSREGDSRSEELAATTGIKTLSGNEVPQRSSDGRLSFYV